MSTDIQQAIERAAEAKLSGHCYAILAHLRQHNWEARALDLAPLGGLNYRGRISDLRARWAIQIDADPAHPPPGTCATYRIAPEHRPRAAWLLDHLTLAGYQEAPRQRSLL